MMLYRGRSVMRLPAFESRFHYVIEGTHSWSQGFLRLSVFVHGKSVFEQGYFPALEDGNLDDTVQLAYALQYVKRVLDQDDGVR